MEVVTQWLFLALSWIMWKGLYYAILFGAVFLIAALLLIPTSLVQRFRRKRQGKTLGSLGRTIYFIPSISIVLLGILPVKANLILLLDIDPVQWILLFLFALYLGLRFMKKAESDDKIGVARWVKQWPGWFGTNVQEPESGKASEVDLARLLALPGLTVLLSLTDTLGKFAGFFQGNIAVPLIQIFLVAGSIGMVVHVLTATEQQQYILGGTKTVLKYPKGLRFTCLVGAVLSLFFWGISAGYEAPSDLKIAAETLPKANERLASLTLVNQSKEIRILKEFYVESRTRIPFYCRSGDFDIPVIAQYKLKFHIASPLTVIAAEPTKKFPPNLPGRVDLALEPNATGACSSSWESNVRISVVSDDDRRSKTSWFQLRKS